MARSKRGSLGYIFSASLLPACLIITYHDLGVSNDSNLSAMVFFCLFFLLLSVLWDVFGMISLAAEDAGVRLIIGVSLILFQVGAYYWLWRALGISVGGVSF